MQATLEDTGEYICEAENIAGRAQSNANIIIHARLIAPYFTEGMKNLLVQEGDSIHLIVKADGHPPPTVKWLVSF